MNLLLLTKEAKIGVLPVDATGVIWMEKWAHVLEEMVLRYGPYPNGFERDILHSEPFPDFASQLAGKAAEEMARRSLQPGLTFIKYGKRQFMRALHRDGNLRIQPASFFKAPTHNGAVRDDELTITFSASLDREAIAELVVNPDDVPAELPDQRVDLEFKHQSDYWLYCVTTSVQPRLFVDFEADACVIINDRNEFSRRIAATAVKTVPTTTLHQDDAIYFDSLLPPKDMPFVPLTKPFGYSYQSEYRFCWLPNERHATLEPVDISLGSLEDISELIELSTE